MLSSSFTFSGFERKLPRRDLLKTFPVELFEAIFVALASTQDGVSSFLNLAMTCRHLYDVLQKNSILWKALFAFKYDLCGRHLVSHFDFQQEYKTRHNVFKKLTGSTEDLSENFLASVNDLIQTLVFEHRSRNLGLLLETPGIVERVRSQVHQLDYQPPWSVIAVILCLADDPPAPEKFAKSRRFMSFSVALLYTHPLLNDIQQIVHASRRLSPMNPADLDTVLEANLGLLYLFSLNSVSLPPLPQGNIEWLMWLGVRNKRVLDACYLPHALKTLEGRWTGYETYISEERRVGGPISFTIASKRDFSETHGLLPDLIVSGDGMDENGHFELNGTVESHGQVMIRKQNASTDLREYYGWLLPWGIVGVYRGGLFWFWPAQMGDEKRH